MPAFLTAAFQYIGAALLGAGVSTLGAAMMMYAGYIATATILIGGLAYSSSQQRKAKNSAREQFNAAQVDRLASISSTIAPRELVLGRVRKAGAIFYRASTGKDSQDLYMAIALAGHEIDAVEGIYLNDALVTLDGSGNVTSAPYGNSTKESRTSANYPTEPNLVADSVTAYPPSGADEGWSAGGFSYQVLNTVFTVKITTHLGQAGQTVNADLLGAFPADWPAAHVVQGVAYLVVKMTYNETAFPSGVPNVSAVIRGAKIFDPRAGTTMWSENPALMLRHVYLHPKFGKATAVTAAEDARIIAGANACDAATTYTVGGVTQASRALYKAALVLPFGAPAKSAFDDLSQAMGGSWAFAGGELYLKAGVYTAPVLALNEADLAVIQRDGASETQKPIGISVHRERAQKFNSVKATIWDGGQDYKQTSLTPLTAAALVTRDGAELVQEVQFPGIGYAPQALHVAGIMMRDARDPLVVELPFKLRAYPLELFDTVSLTIARYGWSAKQFMVLGRSWQPDGSISLTLKETAAAITQMDASFSAQGFAANTNLPTPWQVATVGTLTISSGTAELIRQADGTVISRMRISWPQVTDKAVQQAGKIEVQYRRSDSTGVWASLVAEGDDTQVVTADVQDNVYYVIRARAKTTLAVGDWSVQTQHLVIGKTEPPANVAAFSIAGATLSWSPVADVDLAGYVLRFHYGANFDWGSATPLHTGLITESPFVLVNQPGGGVSIMVKAQDSSGNQSLATANIAADLGDAPIANVVETVDFDALGYPGTITGGVLSGGNLLANNTNGFYGPGTQSFYGEGAESFYKTTSYDALVYTSNEVSINSALAGSMGTIAQAHAGADYRLEYRLAGPSSFYGAGAFYGDGTAPFYDGPSAWLRWSGQLAMTRDVYQFRVTLGAGAVQGRLSNFALTVDAPDMVESVNDLAIDAAGTVVPYTKAFTAIKNVQVTLQANASGAETIEIDKTSPLAPKVRAFNAAHTAVSGATADITLKGY